MLHETSEKIVDFFFDKDKDYPKEIYVYGIELAISSLIGSIIVMVIGLIVNCVLECGIYLIVLSSTRLFTGGYHANSYLKCNIITILATIFSIKMYFVIKLYLSDYIWLMILLLIISLLSTIILFCPIENKNKSIDAKEKKTVQDAFFRNYYCIFYSV